MQNQCKSQITTTQASASPGDSSMGTTGPDYMGIGMGPRARPGFVRKLCKKTIENTQFRRPVANVAFELGTPPLGTPRNSTKTRPVPPLENLQ